MNRSKNAAGSTSTTDQRVGAAAPAAVPVGDGHAASQRARQLDVDRRGPRLHEIRIQCHRGGQRIVKMRQIAFALVEVELEVEPHRILEHPDQRVGRRRPGAAVVEHAHRHGRRTRGGRQPAQYRRRHRDVLGQVQPQHNRKMSRLLETPCRAPYGEHLGGGLGVDADVPFRHGRGVASVLECATHDRQPSQQLGQRGLAAQRECQVGQRAGGHTDELARVGVRRADPRPGRVVGGERPVGRRQVRVTQSLGPVGIFGSAQCSRQRLLGSLGHRHAGDLAQLQQAQVVAANLLHRHVSRG